jgi:hypothetical protein
MLSYCHILALLAAQNVAQSVLREAPENVANGKSQFVRCNIHTTNMDRKLKKHQVE